MTSEPHRPLRLSLCVMLALGAGQLDASSPAFCSGDDRFAIDVNSNQLPVLPPSRLFPDLGIDDFPRTADTVRVQMLEQLPDQLSYNVFHRSGANLGRFARVHAEQSIDAATGHKRYTMTRMDNACLAAADAARVDPERACASLIASELSPGAYTLEFRDPMANHQLQFTMTQSLRDRDEWNLVPSRRAGEPDHLQLRTTTDSNGLRHAHWHATDSIGRDAYAGSVSAEIPLSDIEDSGFDAFASGLLSGMSFFDELTDAHRDWVLYFEQEDLFEPPPSPGDEDGIYGCEPAGTVCGAEYDTCVPTPDGWLGCNYDPGGTWGGGPGGGEPPFENDDDPQILPDWQAGSFLTTPKRAPPKFHGMHLDYGVTGGAPTYGFSYDFVSLLQRANTVPKALPSAPTKKKFHMVAFYLTTDNSTTFICGIGRGQNTDLVEIPVAAEQPYRSPDETCLNESNYLHCVLPKRGIYELHYHIDPKGLWDEGSGGEENNIGTMGTVYLHD
jgi:hypothetical protein